MKWLQSLSALSSIVVLWTLIFPGCTAAPRAGHVPRSPDQVLTDFHDAAAKSDESRYFNHFARLGSVFIGTDATERWNLEQFRAFAHPYFAQGKGWTYTLVPGSRSITFVRGTSVAYFDELLQNAKLGLCRGSGVLVIEDEVWKVAQYNLSIPIPNEKAASVVEIIQGKR